MSNSHTFLEVPLSPPAIITEALTRGSRLLIFGETGVGKSFLVGELARALFSRGERCVCICADCGSPAFGVPGAVSMAQWTQGGWRQLALEALCSLDAGRFRMPLALAVSRLARGVPSATVLVDTPGVVRGVAGSELLTGLVQMLNVDTVLALVRAGRTPPLMRELQSLNLRLFTVSASAQARRSAKRQRDRQRTGLWDSYLAQAQPLSLLLEDVPLIGTPPPTDVPAAWSGRQIALLDPTGGTLALGEVTAVENNRLHGRVFPPGNGGYCAILVRDARRSDDGCLVTAKPFASDTVHFVPPGDVLRTAAPQGGPRPVARVGGAFASLINGVFDDPLLHLRLSQQKRSLLFDLGDARRLPTRIAHQVSDVLISHAHIDHIGGFLWLLRARMGAFPACRIFGPPGLARHLENLIGGILWDRIGDTGPRFDVAELHGDSLFRCTLRAGQCPPQPLPDRMAAGGVILDEPTFRIRAITLDHGTPVLAYAFETTIGLNIRKEGLAAMGLTAGPWLTEFKRQLRRGALDHPFQLPNGSSSSVAALAKTLVDVTPTEKLVYATDLADTEDNRRRLIEFTRNAHTFFCESSFLEADAEQARRTGHLTTRGCGEIATAANVRQLVPFHFSRRYAKAPQRIYEEIAATCSRVVVPNMKHNDV